MRELVFEAPSLLEWIGWNIVKRDHLLGSFSTPVPVFCFSESECVPWTLLYRFAKSSGISKRSSYVFAGEVAELLDMNEHDVVECMLKHALLPLVEAGNKSALDVLAGKIGSEPQNMLQNYGHTIIAKCLYEGDCWSLANMY